MRKKRVGIRKEITCSRCCNVFIGCRVDALCHSCRAIRKKEVDATDYQRYKGKRLAYIKKYRSINKERQYEWNKKWEVRNREKRLFIKRNAQSKRARSIVSGSVSFKEWVALKQLYSNTCLGCLRTEPSIKLSMDHIQPLSKGGLHCITNIQPLCRSCNSRKQTRLVFFDPVMLRHL